MDRKEVAAGGHDPEVSNTGGPGVQPLRVSVTFSFDVAPDEIDRLLRNPHWTRAVERGDAASLAGNLLLLRVAGGFRIAIDAPDLPDGPVSDNVT